MFEFLPDYLAERTRLVNHTNVAAVDFASAKQTRGVVYWMRNAMRLDENPALDVARLLAEQLQQPLLIYQGLSERYPFASDRHHIFMLEGGRDVHRQAATAGFSYAFHLEQPTDRRPHLMNLSTEAAAVITEDMPTDPSKRFLKGLARNCPCPIIAVDTACVVPMQLIKQAYTRAFQFRDKTRHLYEARLTRNWPALAVTTRPFSLASLPFEPLDLQTADLSQLVASCQIDHSIKPIRDTVGGRAAGYARWADFRNRRLRNYARDRNNALLDGVSRMSAYLHYGMVSPLRIARETAAIEHAGAEKYLDELLIWRELSYAFCFYHPDHDQWSALPTWAQQTLLERVQDRRRVTYTWEELARGQTEDQLWNAAQASLRMHGELHNNIRMTWGKAILNWMSDPQAALKMIIDLNHRYALDGRDPASYGGILWCLGQFDRPFEPSQPILGTVRPRPTAEHARRLNPEKYWQNLKSRNGSKRPRIGVIGAGLSGLIAARTLQDQGCDVQLFEKSRGVGGRMSTRRLDDRIGIDHGAQYFTVRDPRFARYCESWAQQGLIARWPDENLGAQQRIAVIKQGAIDSFSESTDRWVGVPGMNAICKHLARELTIRFQTRVGGVRWIDQKWRLFVEPDEPGNQSARGELGELGTVGVVGAGGDELGEFDRLIVSAPPVQSIELFQGDAALAARIEAAFPAAAARNLQPCWAAMIELDQPLTDQWIGAFVHDSFISWIARNQTKPDRASQQEMIVVHATPAWTHQHWDAPAEKVTELLAEELWRATGLASQEPRMMIGHRWKYAIDNDPLNVGALFDQELGLALCGDWACGSRVEGAFLSGMAAAGRIAGSLPTTIPPPARQQVLF